jgi:hypothetical protein
MVSRAHGVKESRVILARLLKALMRPGICLRKETGVPYFWADYRDPNIIIRELDGVRERGRFVGGVFRPVAGRKS